MDEHQEAAEHEQGQEEDRTVDEEKADEDPCFRDRDVGTANLDAAACLARLRAP
jgi:hypothetical protein